MRKKKRAEKRHEKRRLTSTQRNAKEESAPRKDENVATPLFPKGPFGASCSVFLNFPKDIALVYEIAYH